MIKIFTSVSLVLFLAACAGTPAKIPLSQTAPVEKTAVADGEAVAAKTSDQKTYKKVCKEEIVTGTRFSKKICRTQAAWDEMERKAKESLDHKNSSMQTNNPTGG